MSQIIKALDWWRSFCSSCFNRYSLSVHIRLYGYRDVYLCV